MTKISRREVIHMVGVAAIAPALSKAFTPSASNTYPGSLAAAATNTTQGGRVVASGRLKQSASRWCYQSIPLPDFCRALAEMGLTGVDLLEQKDWETVRQFGLVCTMGYGGGGSIPDAMNDKSHHETIRKNFEESIPYAAKMGVPNVITFFGNRRGRPDPEAIENCVTGLNAVKKIAEDHGVTICVELLNSKVDHKDYQGDHTAFGVEVIKAVGSPNVKLLYDIYHMQIMEGDIIDTIRKNHQYIGHYHTGGVPGRHELDDTQELNWRAIASAIAATGFKGYFAHEFVPTRDPLSSLRQAVALCDV
ncbi:MAG TPA: sugar phosphate isomerase/epimerase family protein [Blastocatellia bacterium]